MEKYSFRILIAALSILLSAASESIKAEINREQLYAFVHARSDNRIFLDGVISDEGVLIGSLSVSGLPGKEIERKLVRPVSEKPKFTVDVVIDPRNNTVTELSPGGMFSEHGAFEGKNTIFEYAVYVPNIEKGERFGTRVKWTGTTSSDSMTLESGRLSLEQITGQLTNFRVFSDRDQIKYLQILFSNQSKFNSLYPLKRILGIHWDSKSRRLFRIDEPLVTATPFVGDAQIETLHSTELHPDTTEFVHKSAIIDNWARQRVLSIWQLPPEGDPSQNLEIVPTRRVLSAGEVLFPEKRRSKIEQPPSVLIRLSDSERLLIPNIPVLGFTDNSHSALVNPTINNPANAVLRSRNEQGGWSEIYLENLGPERVADGYKVPIESRKDLSLHFGPGRSVSQFSNHFKGGPLGETYNGHQIIAKLYGGNHVLVRLSDSMLGILLTKEDGGRDQVVEVIPANLNETVRVLSQETTITVILEKSKAKFVFRKPNYTFQVLGSVLPPFETSAKECSKLMGLKGGF